MPRPALQDPMVPAMLRIPLQNLEVRAYRVHCATESADRVPCSERWVCVERQRIEQRGWQEESETDSDKRDTKMEHANCF